MKIEAMSAFLGHWVHSLVKLTPGDFKYLEQGPQKAMHHSWIQCMYCNVFQVSPTSESIMPRVKHPP